jgi:hypothetical protein
MRMYVDQSLIDQNILENEAQCPSCSTNGINTVFPTLFCSITQRLLKNFKQFVSSGMWDNLQEAQSKCSLAKSKPWISSVPAKIGIFITQVQVLTVQFCDNCTISIFDCLKNGLHLTYAKLNDTLNKFDRTSATSHVT